MTDLEMIKRPDLWPHWPLLPLKHGARKAVACESFTGETIWLYEDQNLFSFREEGGTLKTPEEIIAAGWQVD